MKSTQRHWNTRPYTVTNYNRNPQSSVKTTIHSTQHHSTTPSGNTQSNLPEYSKKPKPKVCTIYNTQKTQIRATYLLHWRISCATIAPPSAHWRPKTSDQTKPNQTAARLYYATCGRTISVQLKYICSLAHNTRAIISSRIYDAIVVLYGHEPCYIYCIYYSSSPIMLLHDAPDNIKHRHQPS